MSSKKNYQKTIQKECGYRATWMPDLPIEVGFVGKLFDGDFRKYTSLKEKGIQLEVDVEKTDIVYKCSSEGGVNIQTKLSGQLAPPASASLGEADAGILVQFGSSKGFVFKTVVNKIYSIGNLDKVSNAIKTLYANGEWDESYVIITEVVEAEALTAITSRGHNAKIELKANAEVEVGELDIADASLGLGVSSQKNIGTHIIAKGSLRPLYKAMGIKRSWWSSAIDIAPKNQFGEAKDVFEEIPLDESEFDID